MLKIIAKNLLITVVWILLGISPIYVGYHLYLDDIMVDKPITVVSKNEMKVSGEYKYSIDYMENGEKETVMIDAREYFKSEIGKEFNIKIFNTNLNMVLMIIAGVEITILVLFLLLLAGAA